MARTMEPFKVVAEGVYWLERAAVNCYLIRADDGIVLVDAGLPGTWPRLVSALASFGATPADLDAVVLTHGHFDHVGMCERLNREHRVPIHVHPRDQELARHPYRYRHEASRLLYPVRYPKSIPILAGMAAGGALRIKGVDALPDVEPGVSLPVAGGLTPMWSPGHTRGHCGFHLGSMGILFSGDALVTLDPYTGRKGPRVVARAATADSTEALLMLDVFAATRATLVLPGHGAPYHGDVRAAVEAARAVGVD
ncbi:MAG TPA: MBL fold metallo-hydrolase [Microbacterium sp.]|nr:MBL fold metallo-hydrolase [Microbacterium sp.]